MYTIVSQIFWHIGSARNESVQTLQRAIAPLRSTLLHITIAHTSAPILDGVLEVSDRLLMGALPTPDGAMPVMAGGHIPNPLSGALTAAMRTRSAHCISAALFAADSELVSAPIDAALEALRIELLQLFNGQHSVWTDYRPLGSHRRQLIRNIYLFSNTRLDFDDAVGVNNVLSFGYRTDHWLWFRVR